MLRRALFLVPLTAAACIGGVDVPPATQIAFTTQPSSVPAGEILGGVAVAFLTADGRVVASQLGTIDVHLIATNGATLAGDTSQFTITGIARFYDLTIAKAGTGYRLVAKSAGFDSTVSAPFDISSGAAMRVPATVACRTAPDIRRMAQVNPPFFHHACHPGSPEGLGPLLRRVSRG